MYYAQINLDHNSMHAADVLHAVAYFAELDPIKGHIQELVWMFVDNVGLLGTLSRGNHS